MSTPVLSYEAARNRIRNGDIVFIKDRMGFLGSIIRFLTRSRYSHVGIAFWMDSGGVSRLMMVEAQGGTNRRIVNLSKYRGINLDVVEAPEDWNIVAEIALAQLSEVPYGYIEAAYVGVVEAMQKYFNITLPRKNFYGEICSEFVARVYNLPEEHVSPQGLMDQLQEAGYNIRLQVKG